jgi:hypothetical protein
VILGITVFYGVYAIAIGLLVSGIIFTLVNAYPNVVLLKYSYKEQWKDIMPSLFLSLIMGALIYNFKWLNLAPWITLIIQVFSGVIIYIGLAKIFKLECYNYLLSTFRGYFLNRRGE